MLRSPPRSLGLSLDPGNASAGRPSGDGWGHQRPRGAGGVSLAQWQGPCHVGLGGQVSRGVDGVRGLQPGLRLESESAPAAVAFRGWAGGWLPWRPRAVPSRRPRGCGCGGGAVVEASPGGGCNAPPFQPDARGAPRSPLQAAHFPVAAAPRPARGRAFPAPGHPGAGTAQTARPPAPSPPAPRPRAPGPRPPAASPSPEPGHLRASDGRPARWPWTQPSPPASQFAAQAEPDARPFVRRAASRVPGGGATGSDVREGPAPPAPSVPPTWPAPGVRPEVKGGPGAGRGQVAPGPPRQGRTGRGGDARSRGWPRPSRSQRPREDRLPERPRRGPGRLPVSDGKFLRWRRGAPEGAAGPPSGACMETGGGAGGWRDLRARKARPAPRGRGCSGRLDAERPRPHRLAREGAPRFLRAEDDAPPYLFPRGCYGNRGGAATVGLGEASLARGWGTRSPPTRQVLPPPAPEALAASARGRGRARPVLLSG